MFSSPFGFLCVMIHENQRFNFCKFNINECTLISYAFAKEESHAQQRPLLNSLNQSEEELNMLTHAQKQTDRWTQTRKQTYMNNR